MDKELKRLNDKDDFIKKELPVVKQKLKETEDATKDVMESFVKEMDLLEEYLKQKDFKNSIGRCRIIKTEIKALKKALNKQERGKKYDIWNS